MDGAEVEDLDMEVTVLTDPAQAEHGIVRVRAEVPSRWPELAGTGITASAGEWQAQGQTDDNGEVTFTGLPLTLLDQLRVEVSP